MCRRVFFDDTILERERFYFMQLLLSLSYFV